MINKTLFTGVLAMVLAGSCVGAAEYTSVREFGSSAQTIGRGYIEGFNKSSGMVFENPAGLYRIKGMAVSFFTANLIDDIRFLNGSYAVKTPYGTFGVGYFEMGASDFITGQN